MIFSNLKINKLTDLKMSYRVWKVFLLTTLNLLSEILFSPVLLHFFIELRIILNNETLK